jgi:malonate transporter and related proteins
MNTTVAVVVPLFGLILAGYISGRLNLLDSGAIKGLNVFVFNFAVPALLVRSLAGGGSPQAGDLDIVYAYFAGALLIFALGALIGRFVFRTTLAEQALMGMTAAFGNVVMMGIPLAYVAFGSDAILPITLVASFHSPLMLPLTMVLVELDRGHGDGLARVAGQAALAVFTNPIVLSIIVGVVWSHSGWAVPGPVDGFLQLLSGAAAPCALFALGATLAQFKLGGNRAEIATLLVIKLTLMPACVWAIATYVFRLPDLHVGVATILAALPSGANPFILARRYDIFVARSASAVLMSTAVSVVTIALLLARYAPVP